jgi:hypothetical protein
MTRQTWLLVGVPTISLLCALMHFLVTFAMVLFLIGHGFARPEPSLTADCLEAIVATLLQPTWCICGNGPPDWLAWAATSLLWGFASAAYLTALVELVRQIYRKLQSQQVFLQTRLPTWLMPNAG